MRTIAGLITGALIVIGCGSSQPQPSTPQSACDSNCSLAFASCEAGCDAASPMDMGNTEKQIAIRDTAAPCHRRCNADEQRCRIGCQ